ELLRAAVGAAGLVAAGLVVRRGSGGVGDPGGRPPAPPAGGGPGLPPPARPAGAAPVRPAPAPAPGDDPAAWAIGGLTPEVTPNRRHYTVDTAIIDPDVDAGSWRLRVEGLVGRPVEVGYDELLAMAAIEQYVTLQCISNLVGG